MIGRLNSYAPHVSPVGMPEIHFGGTRSIAPHYDVPMGSPVGVRSVGETYLVPTRLAPPPPTQFNEINHSVPLPHAESTGMSTGVKIAVGVGVVAAAGTVGLIGGGVLGYLLGVSHSSSQSDPASIAEPTPDTKDNTAPFLNATAILAADAASPVLQDVSLDLTDHTSPMFHGTPFDMPHTF